MARIFITGSADGLGLAAARTPMMGGPAAPDDLRLGHVTQVWLGTTDEDQARENGGYWYHQQRSKPHYAVHDLASQTS